MFDFDFDGKLNQEEREFWLKRLKEGFESKLLIIICIDNLYWNADQGDIRIIQKDGKILLADTEFNTDEYEKVK